MTSTRQLVPLDGSLCFAECIDFNVEHNSDLPFWTFSPDETPEEPSVVTHLQFARAAQRAAHLMDARIPSSRPQRQVVAIIALLDSMTYQTTVAALMLIGHIPFPISSRNSPAAVVNLLEKTSCKFMITTRNTLKPLLDEVELLLSEAKSGLDLQIEEAPALREVFPQFMGGADEGDVRPWLQSLTRPDPDDLCLYIHSSGSTGFPKAIPWTHRLVMQWASLLDNYRRTFTTIAVMPLPPFHTMGLFTQLFYPIFENLTAAIYPPRVFSPEQIPAIPSPDNVIQHMKRTRSKATITVPAFLQAWIQSDSAIDVLKTLDCVQYSGGAISRKVGDRFCANLVSIY
ncbi:acetyl-CoA synthetase-like protein, partial [Pluteus cervinus]